MVSMYERELGELEYYNIWIISIKLDEMSAITQLNTNIINVLGLVLGYFSQSGCSEETGNACVK